MFVALLIANDAPVGWRTGLLGNAAEVNGLSVWQDNTEVPEVDLFYSFGMPFFFLGLRESEPTITKATKWPILSAPDDDECGAMDEMLGRGNRSSRRKPATVPLSSPFPHTLTRARSQADAVGSRRLTASATERPLIGFSVINSELIWYKCSQISDKNKLRGP
jgi:hypothetical protein